MEPLHNCRVKRYPDGSADIVAASAPFGGGEIRRLAPDVEEGRPLPVSWEEQNNPRLREARRRARQEGDYDILERVAIQDDGTDDEALQARRRASLERAKRRARVAVRDLGLCNDFRYFVTLTLDQGKIDRYDPKEVVRHLNHWLDNNVRRRGLRYVLVPEHHKDGAIHFHGFFNDALEAVDSGHKDKKGHTVYNLPGWGWGFSTAIALYGERAAAVAYCCKYIAKAQEKIGGRWYYSGGDLRKPDVEWCDVDYASFSEGQETYTVEGVRGVQFCRTRTDVSRETTGGHSDADAAPEETGEAPGVGSRAWRIPRPAPASAAVGAPTGSAARLPEGPSMPPACMPPENSNKFLVI